MNKPQLRSLLLSSASLVLPAVSVTALPSQAAAQTMCSGTPDIQETDINCTDGGDVVVTGATATNTTVTPGEGLMLVTAGAGSQTTVLLAGPDGNTIATTSNSAGAIESNVTGPIHLIASPINLSTTGNLAFGLDLVSTGGPVSGYIGDISTTGTTAPGARLSAGGGIVDFSIGNVTTSGPTSTAVFAMGTGVYLVVGDITTSGQGSAALLANAGAGDTDVTCGNVFTSGAASRGLSIVGTGSISVDCGNITTSAPNLNLAHGLFIDGGSSPIDVSLGNVSTTAFSSLGVLISGEGSITVETGNVATAGGASDGVNIQGADEDVSVATGIVSTLGATSFGIAVTAGTGNVSVDAGNVSTAGTGSRGISINSLSLDEVNLTAGDVSTLGDNSPGIYAFGGFSSFTAETGNVSTAGDNSTAVTLATSGPLNFSSGLISTTGDISDGISLVGFVTTVDIGAISTTGGGSDAAEFYSDVLTGSIGDVSALGGGSNGLDLHVRVDLELTVGNISAWGRAINVADALGVDNVTLTTGSITAREAMFIDADGAINLQTGDIATSAFGPFHSVAIQGGAGPISLSTGDITSTGDHTILVDISGSGAITTDLGNISGPSAGLNGLVINAGGTGNLVTTGFGDISLRALNSTGVLISAAGNEIVLDGGNVSTAGPAVQVTGAAVSGSLGDLSTTAFGAPALLVMGTGDRTLQLGNVTTTGASSVGIQMIFGSGNFSITAGDIATTGAAVLTTTTGTNTIDVGHVVVSGSSTAITAGGSDVNVTADSVTASSNAGIAASSSGGNVTVRSGPVSAGALGGILASTPQGTVDITCSTVQSAGVDGDAVWIRNRDGMTNVNCGVLTTTGADSDGLHVEGSGAVTATIGGATTIGANSDGANIAGAGPITLTNTGAISATGAGSNGISTATGAGATIINTGAITSTDDAVHATSTSGTIGVNVNGNIASSGGVGVYTFTNAANATATVNVAAGRSVIGSIVAIWLDGLGTAIVNNSGTIGTLGGLAIGTQVGVPVTINNLAGATLNGRVDLSHGADSIINAGTWNVAGLNDFLNGSDAVSNLVGGVMNVAPGTSFARLETMTNAGTVNVGGSLTFATVAPTVTNSGTFNLGSGSSMTGVDFFANSGAIVATGGTATIATTFGLSNSGTITMVDGAANDVLTINGLYGGNGGTFAIDVVGTPAGNTADLLRVTSTIASGPTIISPNFVNPAIDPDGVLVVDGGGNIAANAFTLGGVTSQGLINYSLITQGNDVFLATAANEAVFDVGLLGTMNQDMWYQSADAYLACAASRRNEFGTGRKSPVAICGQLYTGRDRSGDSNRSANLFGDTLTYSDRLSTHRRGAQVDLGVSAGANLHAGLTGGYEHAEAQQGTGTNLDLEGYNVGAYAQYGSERGFYAGLMVKRDRYDARMSNPALLAAVDVDARSTGIDGELGWRARGLGALVDLNAGLSHVRSRLDDFTAGNIAFDNDRATSLRGRLGARLAWSGDWAPYIGATAFHEFKGDDDIAVSSGTAVDSFDRRGRGTWGRVEAGLGGGARGGPLLSVWGDVGDVKGWGLRAGFRF